MNHPYDPPEPLPPAALWRASAPPAPSSEALTPCLAPPGQARALEALGLALATRRARFHVLWSSPPEAAGVRPFLPWLRAQLQARGGAQDWCLLPSFDHPERPQAVALPAGEGRRLAEAVERLLRGLAAGADAWRTSPALQAVRRRAQARRQAQEAALWAPLREAAQAAGLALRREAGQWRLEARREGREAQAALARLAPRLAALEDRLPALREAWRRREAAQVRAYWRELVATRMTPLHRRWGAVPAVRAYLQGLERALAATLAGIRRTEDPAALWRRWRQKFGVHCVVEAQDGPLVWVADAVSVADLQGRIRPWRGETDPWGAQFVWTPGELGRANGGVLVLAAEALLEDRAAWNVLKRSLMRGRLEPPEPTRGAPCRVPALPLSLTVVVVGEAGALEALREADPEGVAALFPVLAEVDPWLPRDADTERAYARWLRTLIEDEGLRPFSGEALARVLEWSARWSGEAGRLAWYPERLRALLTEADQQAALAGQEQVRSEAVDAAQAARQRRHGRLRQALLEDTLRGLVLIHSEGRCVGQINGLTVIEVLGEPFGRPVRISARVWPGEGQLTDIEREVALSGPIHDKGVLILHGFLAQRYACRHGLPLAASIVFEQSYGEVEGDSASSAELYALLSALSGVPLRQDLAVTGAVDQHGNVLAVGDVNEKIEGFFELIAARGGPAGHGVLIPAANADDLMLAAPIREAVAAGRFHVYPVAHVDQGLALLTGMSVGRPDAQGHYPPESVNGRILATLASFAERMGRRGDEKDEASH